MLKAADPTQESIENSETNAFGSRRYAAYVLTVLLVANVFNFVDRQILSVLAEAIKQDLGISDTQLGFLFGTAFAIFYAIFGITLSHLADNWNRKKLISLALAVWSGMTAMSGLARSFVPLAVCRFGVAVGEASATPAALSLIYDYFPVRVRTTATAIYSSGLFIGAGLGLTAGGLLLDYWETTYAAGGAPFGLKGWQAVLIAAGLPGLFLSAWVSTLREPMRPKRTDRPFMETGKALLGMLPLVNLPLLLGFGRGATAANLLAGLVIAALAAVLMQLTGDLLQWSVLGLGVYAVFCWLQGLKRRDSEIFLRLIGNPVMVCTILAGGALAFTNIALSFWMMPFMIRNHGVTAGEIGPLMGAASAIMGFVGTIGGGWIADLLLRRTASAKLWVVLFGILASGLAAFLVLVAPSLPLALVGLWAMYLAAPISNGPWISQVNDLMVSRGRATATAFAYMVSAVIGFALGPYLTGRLSDMLAADGAGPGEGLRQAMLWSLGLPALGALLCLVAMARFRAHAAVNAAAD